VPEQRISVAPSVMLACTIGVTHLAAAGLLWVAPLPGPARIVLAFAIAFSLIWFMARDALLHAPHSIVALEIRDGTELLAQTRRGDWLRARLLGSSYVSPSLTIVGLRTRGRWGARHVILVPDNVDPRDFRRLRTWLRWTRGEESVEGDRDGGFSAP
jgi:toxin CptA